MQSSLFIRISDGTGALATLTPIELSGIEYGLAFKEIGDCSFTCATTNAKAVHLKMYNKVELIEGGVVKFLGVILNKTITLNTVTVKCREITYMLKKRLVSEGYVANGQLGSVVSAVLGVANATQTTGITAGTLTDTTSVNMTFDRANVFEVIKSLCESAGKAFKVGTDGKLSVGDIGTDLSASVKFRYDTQLAQAANIVSFRVSEDGEQMVTKSYAASGALRDTKTKAGATYILESYRDFRVVQDAGTLSGCNTNELQDSLLTPEIELMPDEGDTFTIGDRVQVIIRNSLIDINTAYQVLSKRVRYVGVQRKVTVQVNKLPYTLGVMLSEQERRLQLLEKQL